MLVEESARDGVNIADNTAPQSADISSNINNNYGHDNYFMRLVN